MSEEKTFQQECDDYVKGVADRLEELYYGTRIEELEEELEALEDEMPEEPEQEDGETDEAYDIRYEAYEKEYDEWYAKQSNLEDELDEAKERETLRGYFDDYLDLSYIVNGSKDYEGVRVWVTIGGPSVYIDTDKGAVVLNWGGTHSEYYLSSNVVQAVDEIFEEYYDIA